jgi:hypothetical protein
MQYFSDKIHSISMDRRNFSVTSTLLVVPLRGCTADGGPNSPDMMLGDNGFTSQNPGT